ncbi:hypothetical protein QQF64_008594 [Cirrhinus molitorella]|uniref:Uncharacterized protein n=1 Tax=Cirrhinus molitorella TaxID=172907 RepID=A0ABR3M6L7_9TELE
MFNACSFYTNALRGKHVVEQSSLMLMLVDARSPKRKSQNNARCLNCRFATNRFSTRSCRGNTVSGQRNITGAKQAHFCRSLISAGYCPHDVCLRHMQAAYRGCSKAS